MNLTLAELPLERYVEDVLPHTFGLWGYGRSYEQYVTQTQELVASGYGRRYYRTLALDDGNRRTLSSCKRYEREARASNIRLRGAGFGGIFTPPQHRGKGFASAMIGLALDGARSEGFDFAFLFSDIHPHFYEQLGFRILPSRSFSLRADSLEDRRITVEAAGDSDWSAIRACFSACEAARGFAFLRTPLTWEWIRTRLRHRSDVSPGQPIRLIVRHGRSLRAYVFGRREPLHDALIVEEIAYASESARELIPSLLRSAAGDLRRIAGWLPPAPVRSILPRGSVRRRSEAIWMIAPLTQRGAAFAHAATASPSSDGVWTLDHV